MGRVTGAARHVDASGKWAAVCIISVFQIGVTLVSSR